MQVGEIKTLNKDNKFKSHVWGKKGEKVKVFSISGTAVTYEKLTGLRKGEKFPCNIKDLE